MGMPIKYVMLCYVIAIDRNVIRFMTENVIEAHERPINI